MAMNPGILGRRRRNERFSGPPLSDRLAVWVKGDAGISLNVNDVAAWANQGNRGGSFSQGTAANQPLYVPNARNGLPIVRFNGTTDFLSMAAVTLPGYYTVLVALIASGTAGIIVEHSINANSESGFWLYGTNTFESQVFRAANFHRESATPNWLHSAWHVGAARVGPSGMVVRRDGAAWDTTGSGGDQGDGDVTKTLHLGARAGTSLFLNADVGEILIYEDPLSDADFAAAEEYLGARWGVTIS